MSKMQQLISATADYEPMVGTNIGELESKNNIFVDKLFKLNAVNDKREYWDLATSTSQMYGLIKIHKENHPVRPITSACGAPGFKLSKFITQILTLTFPEEGYHVKNSLMVKNNLLSVTPEEDEMLVSFDVTSMFTNISIDLMLSLISERSMFIEKRFKIPWPLFQELFRFLLEECAVFTFNDIIYKQKESLAMGSPISPILAKILMTRILEYVITKSGIKPKFVALYVDDSIWLLKKHHIELVLDNLNSFNDRINFTMELESDSGINFLDIRIIRCGNRLITRWYKKPFASLRILNFFSNHNRTCIVQTAIAFVRMVLRLSDGDFFQENRETLIRMLRFNCFPEDLIIRIMHDHYTLMRPLHNSEKEDVKFAPIPFHSGFSEALKERMISLHPGYKLVSVPDRSTTTHFSYIKDKVKLEEKTNMISLLTCQCKKYIDIRHTKFGERANTIVSFCKQNFDTSDGKCVGKTHKMNVWKFVRCKNYPTLLARFNALIHANRHKLQYYTASQTDPRLKKIIDKMLN